MAGIEPAWVVYETTAVEPSLLHHGIGESPGNRTQLVRIKSPLHTQSVSDPSLAERAGIEPDPVTRTDRFPGGSRPSLDHSPLLVELVGIEPTTSAMPLQRSSQLSYSPVVVARDTGVEPV